MEKKTLFTDSIDIQNSMFSLVAAVSKRKHGASNSSSSGEDDDLISISQHKIYFLFFIVHDVTVIT